MAKKSLEEVRAEVERIDEQIIELIAMRTELAEDILVAKREAKVGIDDPDQMKKVLNRARSRAMEKNIDVEAVERIFEILLEMNVERQRKLAGKLF